MKPIRIQRSRQHKQESLNGLEIKYVGRPTRWGNPFTVGCNASQFSIVLPSCVETVEQAIACYRYWLDLKLMVNKDFIKPLKGKNLSCWCKIGEPCHADVLLELLNQ